MERIDPEQETRNDDPALQERQRQKSSGRKDQAEGERAKSEPEDERVNPEVAPDHEKGGRQPRK